jgi:hypothetical protein
MFFKQVLPKTHLFPNVQIIKLFFLIIEYNSKNADSLIAITKKRHDELNPYLDDIQKTANNKILAQLKRTRAMLLNDDYKQDFNFFETLKESTEDEMVTLFNPPISNVSEEKTPSAEETPRTDTESYISDSSDEQE